MKSSSGPVRLGSKIAVTLNKNFGGGVNSHSPREPFGYILPRQKLLSFWLWHHGKSSWNSLGLLSIGSCPRKAERQFYCCV